LNRPWTPEKLLSNSEAKKIIEENFKKLSPVRLLEFGKGWDNTVYLVNEKYVFLFPRRQVAAGLLRNEINVLPHIENLLPVPIPKIKFIIEDCKDFDWPVMGYEMIKGKTVCRAGLTEAERSNIAPAIAEFLKCLHNLSYENLEIPEDMHGRLNIKDRIRQAKENISEMKKLNIDFEYDKLIGFLKRFNQNTIFKNKLCIVHGDLYSRHILINEFKKISGIIDWGDIHLGNPAVDLSIMFSFLPRSARAVFKKRYGKIDESTLQLARLRAIYHTTTLIIYACSENDTDLFNESMTGLNYTSED